jgi:plastocyanin
MIWRSLICFSLCAGSVQAASLSGSIALRDSRQKDYSGVVVSAIPADTDTAAMTTRHGTTLHSTTPHSTMLQKNKTFLPHVLPVQVGATVDFPNADPIFHNAFSSYSGQIFDIGLYAPGTTRSVHFVRPGVVRVFCNIHPTMSAIILVVNSPYFATTAKDGSWEMNVPPGDYDIKVFHERATEQTLAGLSLRIVVGDLPVKLPTIADSEAGYLLAPHKNKYGHDYDSAPDDQSLYPAVHR